MIYIFVFIFLLIPVILFDILGIKKGRRGWYLFEFCILVLLAGFRYRVGGDTLFYMSFFDDYPKMNELINYDFENAGFNPFWYIFNAFTKFIHDDFTTFQVVQAVIVNSVFFWFFRKYSKFYFSAILMYYFAYYFYFNMEILRAIFAICCFMLSIPAFNKKKYLTYFVLCFISILFHSSGFILIFIPLLRVLFKNTTWKHLIIISFVLGILLSTLSIIPYLSELLSFNDLISVRLEIYMDNQVNITNILFYYLSILPILYLLYINEKNNVEFAIVGIKELIISYVILMIFAAFYHTIFTRLADFFKPFYIIYVIESFYTYFKSNRGIFTTLFVKTSLFVVLFFQSYYYWRDQSEYYPGARFYTLYYPYNSIFNPIIDQKREDFLSNMRDSDGF